jgi:hypothetical protein
MSKTEKMESKYSDVNAETVRKIFRFSKQGRAEIQIS